MKIISNFRDYYDYLMGIYGQDPKIAYERICLSLHKGKWIKSGIFKPYHLLSPERFEFYMLAIGGTCYCIFYYNNKFYIPTSEIIEKSRQEKWWSKTDTLKSELLKTFGKMPIDRIEEMRLLNGIHRSREFHLKKIKLNETENCPVILFKYDGITSTPEIKNPRLADFGIKSFIPAEAMYLMISDFLSREKPIADKRTDIQKLESKGFDKKTSFRKIK